MFHRRARLAERGGHLDLERLRVRASYHQLSLQFVSRDESRARHRRQRARDDGLRLRFAEPARFRELLDDRVRVEPIDRRRVRVPRRRRRRRGRARASRERSKRRPRESRSTPRRRAASTPRANIDLNDEFAVVARRRAASPSAGARRARERATSRRARDADARRARARRTRGVVTRRGR